MMRNFPSGTHVHKLRNVQGGNENAFIIGSLTNLTLDLQTLPTLKADVTKMTNGKWGTSRGNRKIKKRGTKLNVSPRPNSTELK